RAAYAYNSRATNASPAIAPAKSSTNSDGYRIEDKHLLEPGDRISFLVKEDRDPLPRALVVTDSKELDFPYIGRVSVAGKTCKQVTDMITPMLEHDYYYRATVILGLDSVNPIRGKIYIEGAVKNTGPLDLKFNENLTAGQAILRAGGF